MKPLSKVHAEAVAKAKTHDEQNKAAAMAMIETPLELIKAIMLKHELAVIEVMRELHESREAALNVERKALLQLFTDPENQPTQYGTVTVEYMQREIAAEREACAAVCCGMIDAEYKTGKVDHNEMAWTQACAAAIRARSKT